MASVNGTANGVAFNATSAVPLHLDGKQIVTETTFDVISPLDHKTCWPCSSATEKDAIAAIESAERAFKSWSKTKPSVRQGIFTKAAELLRQEQKESRAYSYTETGAPEVMFGFEYEAAIQTCLSLGGLIGTIEGFVPTVDEEGASAMVVREPYGVVLGIAPWNGPHVLGMRACLSPLAVGNTVVLKGPEASPATYWHFVDILHRAGLPGGVLNTIYHRPQDASKVTTTLIEHPAIKKVNFTGSTNVGSIIASLCGKHLKPCLMELGGKAPSIVCADANLDTAAMFCALGAFTHAGQICMSTERIIVDATVADAFKAKLRGAMDNLFGADKGAAQLVNAPPVTKNHDLVKDAISKGAKTVYGDANSIEDSKTQMRPVIIENVSKEMSIYYTESFGPTVSLYMLPAENFEDEALRLANDTDYGLSSAVFTEDLRRGLRIAKGIETGAVHINSMTIHDEARLPHGGAKKSGFGRFNTKLGLEEWVRLKTITWKD